MTRQATMAGARSERRGRLPRASVSQSRTAWPALPRHPPLLPGSPWQRAVGNQAYGGLIQTQKLTVSTPHDPYEQEADRVADEVMRGSAPSSGPAIDSSGVQRMCTECEDEVQRQVVDTDTLFPPEDLKRDEEEEARVAGPTIQTKRLGPLAPFAAPPSVSAQLARSGAGGEPLSVETRRFMEPRFGTSFADVRVHTDAQATVMCASIDAKAFTYGRDVYFGTHWYSPTTREGQHLLAHELTHVEQQGQSTARLGRSVSPTVVQRACQHFPAHSDPDSYCETEEEARATIARACPPYRDDFLYRDGPATHPWRRIPGYGCAHHVAHILGITNGPAYANCRGGFSVTIDQITQGRAAQGLANAQVNDIWSTGVHSGVVTQVDAAVPRVRVNQCGTGGNAQQVWYTDGDVYR